MFKVIVKDGHDTVLVARTAEELVSSLRKGSWFANNVNRDYMEDVSRRIKDSHQKVISYGNCKMFIADMVANGFLEEI